jgi:MFS family permease
VILGLALAVGLVVAWALGANLLRISAVQFRAAWLVFLALGLQIVIFTPLASHLPKPTHTPIHVLTYVLLVAFLVANLRIPGFWMAGIGMLANLAVIVANNGLMPVSLAAWKATGSPASAIASGAWNNNVLAGPHTRLGLLGDIFAFPPVVPFASAVSVGDVLIVLGMVAFVYRSCTPRTGNSSSAIIAPLRYPAFRRVIVGRLTSKLGDWLTQAATVTWIYSTTHSTLAVSAALLARMAGSALGGVAAAPIINRLGGFRLLSSVELLRGGAAVLMIPFALSGQVWPVIALSGLSSLLASSTAASASSLVPDVLPQNLVHAGNALHGVARNITLVLGALAGGALVVKFGITTALLVDIASFVAAAAVYWAYSAPAPEAGPDISRRAIGRAMIRNPVVLGLTASFTVVCAATGLLNAALPATFEHQLGDAHAYGYALAILGSGLLCGELLTGLIERESVARRSVSLAFLGIAACTMIIAHSHVQTTILLMIFLLGASDGTTEIVYDTLIQRYTPREILGGVFAIASSVQVAGMMLGLAAAPLLLHYTSIPTVLRTAATACVAGAAIAAASLARRGGSATFPSYEVATASDWSLQDRLGIHRTARPASAVDAASSRATSQHLPTTSTPLVVAALGHPVHPDRQAMIEELQRSLQTLGAALRTTSEEESGQRLGDRGHGGVWIIDVDEVVRFAFAADGPDQWIPASFVTGRLKRLAAGGLS